MSDQLQDSRNQIEELSSRNSTLEAILQQNNGTECAETSEESKTREDLEIDIAHLEKDNQDQAHQLLLAHDHLAKMKENWDRDKESMLDYQMKFNQSTIAMKSLSDKLDASEAQLKQSRSLNNSSAIKPTTITARHPEPLHLLNSLSPQAEEEGSINGDTQVSVNGYPDPKDQEPTPSIKEICLFELVEKGRCQRKDRCKFSHRIEPHMEEQKWKETKLTEISKKLGRCAVEMTGKGSCAKKNECMFSHLNRKTPHRQGAKDLCFLELEEAGKCQRGSSCRFSHAISQAMRDDAEIQRKVQEQKQSKRGICINEFRCPNSCLKGERCTFRHEISEQENKSSVLKEKMEQKWKTITGRTSNDEENLDKSTAIVMLQEFRNLMKNFNKVMGSHRP